jgi:hypothetical protein
MKVISVLLMLLGFGCAASAVVAAPPVQAVNEGCMLPQESLFGTKLLSCYGETDTIFCVYGANINMSDDKDGSYTCKFLMCQKTCKTEFLLIGGKCTGTFMDSIL